MAAGTDSKGKLEVLVGNGQKPTIVVTGFGPFGEHDINASWEVAKQLEQIWSKEHAKLVIKEIPVCYKEVKKIVPELWELHKPKLMVHCGVSGLAREITLEQVAYNVNYIREDVNADLPCQGICVEGREEQLKSEISMNKVCNAMVGDGETCKVPFVVSNDAGRYLCEFIYYTSLSICSKCSAFVHVPPIDSPYSVQEMAGALKLAIEAMLDQIDSQECNTQVEREVIFQLTAENKV